MMVISCNKCCSLDVGCRFDDEKDKVVCECDNCGQIDEPPKLENGDYQEVYGEIYGRL